MLGVLIAALSMPIAGGIAFYSVCTSIIESGPKGEMNIENNVLRGIGYGIAAAMVVGCLIVMLTYACLKPPAWLIKDRFPPSL
jgi:hypothetical protein